MARLHRRFRHFNDTDVSISTTFLYCIRFANLKFRANGEFSLASDAGAMQAACIPLVRPSCFHLLLHLFLVVTRKHFNDNK
jgi:hypothetical protein